MGDKSQTGGGPGHRSGAPAELTCVGWTPAVSNVNVPQMQSSRDPLKVPEESGRRPPPPRAHRQEVGVRIEGRGSRVGGRGSGGRTSPKGSSRSCASFLKKPSFFHRLTHDGDDSRGVPAGNWICEDS